jgi:hypothetical protein
MPPSGILSHVVLVGNDVSEERSASITRMTRIGELGKTLAVTSNPKHAAQIVVLRSVRRLLVTANAVPS